MLCKKIILLAFPIGQDQEILDNVVALTKKYGTRQVISVSIPVGSEKDAAAASRLNAAAEQLKTATDNGLYLILHSGPTRSKPDSEILADIVASAFINQKIRFRKINLAGCVMGGDKLNQRNLDSSVLKTFCNHLLSKVNNQDDLNGTFICAYRALVTTYDEESSYYRDILINNPVLEERYAKPEGVTDRVHNLVQDPNSMQLRRTHLSAIAEDVEKIKAHHTEKYGAILQGTPIKRILKGKPVKELTPESQIQYYQTYAAQMGVYDKKGKALDDRLKQLTASYESYIKTKIVVVYNGKSQEFEIASLAEYSDNQTAQQMVTLIETYQGPRKLQLSL